ncbi:MAG: hypothetical protein J5986_01460 [Roseburia sp.]|nr:hypothetical protein [Roseburia sp.]
MNSSFWVLVFGGVFFIATILLQVYLSKRESKVPGLVLPVITFLIAVFVTVEVILAGVMYGETETQVQSVAIENKEAAIENEEAVDGSDIPGIDSNDATTQFILVGIATFFLYNLPTLLYGGIYIFCRKRKNMADGGKNSAVDKMKIQDL